MNRTNKILQKPFTLDAIHDVRHRLDDAPLARESLVFMLQLPEEDIAAFVYTWVSGESKAGAAFCVYGPGLGREPIFDVCDGIPVPFDMGFDDWRVGAVQVRHGRPLETAEVAYRGAQASLDYRFEAMHPAYNYGSHSEGCPQWFANDRFEQSGWVKGVLKIGDREIPFDTFGHRDHSWGTRDWGIAQHWKWLEAQVGPDVAVHVFECQATGHNILRGYVQKEGHIAEVSGVQFSFKHDADLYHTEIKAVVEDTAGRTTVVNGRSFAMYEFKVSPLATLNEGSMEVVIDGKTGVGHVEMCWPKAYLDYLRQRAA